MTPAIAVADWHRFEHLLWSAKGKFGRTSCAWCGSVAGLRIQRMPSEADTEFGNPANYPYMCVASPSCHDTSTTRAWYEEDPDRRQRFYNNVGYIPPTLPSLPCVHRCDGSTEGVLLSMLCGRPEFCSLLHGRTPLLTDQTAGPVLLCGRRRMLRQKVWATGGRGL